MRDPTSGRLLKDATLPSGLGGSTYSTGPHDADLPLRWLGPLSVGPVSPSVGAPSHKWFGGAGDRTLHAAASTPVPSLCRYGETWGEAKAPSLCPGTASPRCCSTPVPSLLRCGDVRGEPVRPHLCPGTASPGHATTPVPSPHGCRDTNGGAGQSLCP
eukprot:5856329-Amphidinium_carterae.2